MKLRITVKKAASMFFVLLMAASVVFWSFSASAAGPVSLVVSSVNGAAGEDVDLSINISKDSGLAAAGFLIKYDNTKLSYKSNAAGSASVGGYMSVNEDNKTDGSISTINCSFIHVDGIKAGGPLVDLKFTIKSGWTGSTPVTLSVGDFVTADYKTIAHSVTDGSVSLSSSGTTVPVATETSGPANTTVPVTSVSQSSGSDTTALSTTDSGTSAAATTTNSDSTTKAVSGTEDDDGNSAGKTVAIVLIAAFVLIAAALAVYLIKKKK